MSTSAVNMVLGRTRRRRTSLDRRADGGAAALKATRRPPGGTDPAQVPAPKNPPTAEAAAGTSTFCHFHRAEALYCATS